MADANGNVPPLPEPRKPDENGAGGFTAGQLLACGDQRAAAERVEWRRVAN